MTKIERVSGIISCVLAVIGGMFCLLIVGASSMSDAPSSARSMPVAALPLPTVAFVIAAFAFISACRHGNARASLPLTLPALGISGGTLLLASLAMIY